VLGQLTALREQLDGMNVRLITVEREMCPNGGASIRDRVEAIAAATTGASDT
jgi:hypothetical protein